MTRACCGLIPEAYDEHVQDDALAVTRNEVEDFKNKLLEVNEVISQAKEQENKLRQEMEEKETLLLSMIKNVDNLKEKVRHHKEKAAGLAHELETVLDHHKQFEREKRELQDALQAVKESEARLLANVDALKMEQTKHEEEAMEMVAKSEAEIVALRRQLEKTVTRLNRVEEMKELEEKRAAQLALELSRSETERDGEHASKSEEIANLRQTIEQLTTELHATRERTAEREESARFQLERKEKDVQELQERVQQLEDEKHKTHAAEIKKRGRSTTLSDHLLVSNKPVSAPPPTDDAQSSSEVQELKLSMLELMEEKNRLARELEATAGEVSERQRQIAELEQRLSKSHAVCEEERRVAHETARQLENVKEESQNHRERVKQLEEMIEMMEMMKSVSHEEEVFSRDRKISEQEELIGFLRTKLDEGTKEKEELVMNVSNLKLTLKELQQLRDGSGPSTPELRRRRLERWAREDEEEERQAQEVGDSGNAIKKKELRSLFKQLKQTEAQVRDGEERIKRLQGELDLMRARAEASEQRERVATEPDDLITDHELDNEEKMRRESENRRLRAELEEIRRELFFSTAVAIKLNLSQAQQHGPFLIPLFLAHSGGVQRGTTGYLQSGRQCTQNVATLYEQSQREQIGYRSWNTWIYAKLTDATAGSMGA